MAPENMSDSLKNFPCLCVCVCVCVCVNVMVLVMEVVLVLVNEVVLVFGGGGKVPRNPGLPREEH